MSLKKTKTLSITSGKGGVGKTTITSNIATCLAQKGNRVLILDGDLGMGNVDIIFGKKSSLNIYNVLNGEATVNEILLNVTPNIDVIPGGSGILELQRLNNISKQILLEQVSALESKYDYMIVDTAPGIDETVLYLNCAVQDINVIITPDPASLADSYALIKVLNKHHSENKFSIICNQVKDELEGLQLFRKFNDVTDRFLFVSLDYKGSIPTDSLLTKSVKSQQLIVNSSPHAPSCQAIRHLSDGLDSRLVEREPKGGIQFFIEQILSVA